MFGSAVLDTAIGLTFIFFAISTICSSTFSLIARMLELRGRLLEQALEYLLTTEAKGDAPAQRQTYSKLMGHALIQDTSLKGSTWLDRLGLKVKINVKGNKRPPYIDANSFANALIDLCVRAYKMKHLSMFMDQLQTAQVKTLEVGLQQAVAHKLNAKEVHTLITRGESALQEHLANTLDEMVDEKIINDTMRQNVLDEFKKSIPGDENILLAIEEGLIELDLPPRTKSFLLENIKLLRRRNEVNNNPERAFDEFGKMVADWLNNSLDSLTKIFKAQANWFLLGIAIIITLLFNINTVTIADTLWTSPTVRAAVVESANTRVEEANQQEDPTDDQRNPLEIFQEDLQNLNLPVAWTEQELENTPLNIPPLTWMTVDEPNRPVPSWYTRLFGWMLSIGAALLGAPFWFDLLNKLINAKPSKKE